jgi:hypothetical protein
MKRLSHYRRKLADKGLSGIVAGRWRWYKAIFQTDNWLIGKFIEIACNRITIQKDVILSVDNPLVSTRHKSSIYFGIYEIGERALA